MTTDKKIITDRNLRPVEMVIQVDALTEKMLDVAMPKTRNPELRNAFIQSTLQNALIDKLGGDYSKVQQAAEKRLKFEEEEMFKEPTDVKRLLAIEGVTETTILQLERLANGVDDDGISSGLGMSSTLVGLCDQYFSDYIKENLSRVVNEVEDKQKLYVKELRRAISAEEFWDEFDMQEPKSP